MSNDKFVKKDMSAPRDRILMAAWDLFHEQGIDGTSVDQILERSETGKSQFYHYFKSKEGLVHCALETAHQMISSNQIEGCGEIDSWEDLEQCLNSYIEKTEYYNYARVCPLGRFATDLAADDDVVRKDLQLIFEAKKKFLRDFIVKMKAKGELREDADADAIADFCHSATQGASILMKVYKSKDIGISVHKQVIEYISSFKVSN